MPPCLETHCADQLVLDSWDARVLQSSEHHRGELSALWLRLREAERLGIDVEEAGARADDGGHERVLHMQGPP